MADERRGQAVEASPEEARFLRRFVRRTVLPWIAGVGALAGLALGVALSPHPPAVLVAAEPGVAHAPAALDEIRAEIVDLRDELVALRSARSVASQRPGDFEPRLYDLERAVQSEAAARVDGLRTSEQRIERLELRLSTLEAPATAPASPVQ